VAVRQGSLPYTRVVCPRPVVSSTSRASPGPKTCLEPSPRPISSWPARMMTNWRRGAGCQSMKLPTGLSRKEIWVVASPLFHDGVRARSIGSMWTARPCRCRAGMSSCALAPTVLWGERADYNIRLAKRAVCGITELRRDLAAPGACLNMPTAQSWNSWTRTRTSAGRRLSPLLCVLRLRRNGRRRNWRELDQMAAALDQRAEQLRADSAERVVIELMRAEFGSSRAGSSRPR